MFDFYQKRKLRGLLASPVTKVVLVFLILLMGWSALARYNIAKEMQGRRVSAENEVKKLEEQKEALEDKVRYLSDERGIEAEMRRQFDVALPDEQVVVIVDSEEVTEKATTSVLVEESPAWYQFWR